MTSAQASLNVFSPPAWGWSELADLSTPAPTVLPTRVGMVRDGSRSVSSWSGSPHPRGDGPVKRAGQKSLKTFSPPAWGWSDDRFLWPAMLRVLPTRVGMVRRTTTSSTWLRCSPHPRGDGPQGTTVAVTGLTFSPPAWGWSGRFCWKTDGSDVLPTRVGMVRAVALRGLRMAGSPHPRGDGPPLAIQQVLAPEFSPPAWGWSETCTCGLAKIMVLPTRVGMVRPARNWLRRLACSPHPRGDGPCRETEGRA